MTDKQTNRDRHQSLIIGLTGGIGSGKSLATDFFAQYQVPVIDTDRLAHQALDRESSLLPGVLDYFGKAYQLPDGSLDRRKLRERIFQQPQDKYWLEQQVHPWVNQQVQQAFEQISAPYLILSSPLLIEKQQYQWVKRILVIDLPEALQLYRASQRDGQDQESIRRIIQQQVSREQRLQLADDIIDNSRDQQHLQQQVARLHLFYSQLAEALREA